MADNIVNLENRPRLGRGLAALLGAVDQLEPAANSRTILNVPIEFLRPSARNPRIRYENTDLDELAGSIREHGIIQPILVRAIPRDANAYEIIAGERRWRAAQRAEQHEIPIIVVEADDREALEISIVENIQRTNLNALEEAVGYTQLISDYGYSQEDLARIVGKSRSHISNTLRLTNLPEHTQELLVAGQISAGHARALLAVEHPDAIADRIVPERLTVRDVERLATRPRKPRVERGASPRDTDTEVWESKLSSALGAKVTIRHTDGKGEIRIAFRSFDQLDEFCRRLEKPVAVQ
jgi:ParB family chromosome partitioning protein